MDKILLIIQREYITRVRKKSFIVMIFVVPALILAMGYILSLVGKNSQEISNEQTIKVVDQSTFFAGKFQNIKNLKFETSLKALATLKQEASNDENLSLLVIHKNYNAKDSVEIFSKKKPLIIVLNEVEKQINQIASARNLLVRHIDPIVLQSIKSDITLNSIEITQTGDNKTNIAANVIISISCAILIYLSLFIYGAQVMRGVIEEKTSRIIEVIISSVKPFQLMLGKIIGVGLVGLTQFSAWIILSIISIKIAGHTLATTPGTIFGALQVLQTIHFGPILFYFLFYFLSGYLLYSALFAAVGSAVDSETETQQFMFPITLPLLFTYLLAVSVLFQAPDSPLAVWLSIIPFTAPVAMMVRIPFDPPIWQIALSMSLMVIGFLFTTYVAARIYRVGVLMYGKKASYKELMKWFFYKE